MVHDKREDKIWGIEKIEVTFKDGNKLTTGKCNGGYVKIIEHIDVSPAFGLRTLDWLPRTRRIMGMEFEVYAEVKEVKGGK